MYKNPCKIGERLLEECYSEVHSLGGYLAARVPRGELASLQGLCDSIIVGCRAAPLMLPPVRLRGSASSGSSQSSVAIMSMIVSAVVARNLGAGVRCALSRGHRLSYGENRVAADSEAPVVRLPGSTHVDQLLTSEWLTLLALLGTEGIVSLIDASVVSLFRKLPNGCLLQLTGVTLDNDITAQFGNARNRIRPPQAVAHPLAGEVAVPRPFSAVVHGSWLLPRVEVRPIGERRGARLTYVRPLFYTGGLTPRTGFPHSHALMRALVSGAPKEAGRPPPFVSNAAARSLMHHIFVERPHLVDIAMFNRTQLGPSHSSPSAAPIVQNPKSQNSGNAGAAVSRSKRQLSDAHTGEPVVTSRRNAKRRRVAGEAVNYGALEAASVAGAGAPRRRAQRDMRTPAALRAALPALQAFRSLVARHEACPYARLLKQHCGLRDAMKRRPRGEAAANPLNSASPRRAVDLATPQAEVMNFVRACLTAVIPPELWGDGVTRRRFMSHVWTWITLGKRDRSRADVLLRGIPTTAFAVFACGPRPVKAPVSPLQNTAVAAARCPAVIRDSRRQRDAAHAWLTWLLLGYVHPLIRASFYVTDSEVRHHLPLYYRKETWARLTTAATTSLRASLDLQPHDHGVAQQSAPLPLGVAPVRLVPKPSGELRPIMNLAAEPATLLTQHALQLARRSRSAPSSGVGLRNAGDGAPPPPSFTRPINKQLDAAHEVLRTLLRRTPDVAGGSVFGLDGTFAALRRFVAARATAARRRGGPAAMAAPLYIATCDVKGAYDTLLQGIALDTVSRLLATGSGGDKSQDPSQRAESTDPEFELRSYITIVPWCGGDADDWGDTPGIRGAGAGASIRVRYRKAAVPVLSRVPFATQATSLASDTHDTVFIDAGVVERMRASHIYSLVRRHVVSHVVRMPDGVDYIQRRGVPQGSILSSLICNLYLARLEREQLVHQLHAHTVATDGRGDGDVAEPVSLLMRLTDDFLFLSESRAAAAAFVRSMHTGFPDFNVRVSVSKTEATFDIQDIPAAAPAEGEGALCSQRIVARADVRWCGLAFDAHTGAVTGDYSRYEGPGRIREALTITPLIRARPMLARTLRAFIRPKCHPVLLDGDINILPVVALNVFQLMLVTGAKLVVLLRSLRAAGALAGVAPVSRTGLVAQMAAESVDYLAALIRKNCPGPAPPPLAHMHTERTAEAAAERIRHIDEFASVNVSRAWISPTAPSSAAFGNSVGSEHVARAATSLLLIGPAHCAEVLPLASRSAPTSQQAPDGSSLFDSWSNGTRGESSHSPWCPLRRTEVRWLGLTALARAFNHPDGLPPVGALLLQARARLVDGVRTPLTCGAAMQAARFAICVPDSGLPGPGRNVQRPLQGVPRPYGEASGRPHGSLSIPSTSDGAAVTGGTLSGMEERASLPTSAAAAGSWSANGTVPRRGVGRGGTSVIKQHVRLSVRAAASPLRSPFWRNMDLRG